MAADRTPARRRGRLATPDNFDEAPNWERDWRRGVNEAINTLSAQQQQTAILMERIATRLEAMEKGPKEARAWFASANQGVGTLIAIGAFLIAILSTILQHISFH